MGVLFKIKVFNLNKQQLAFGIGFALIFAASAYLADLSVRSGGHLITPVWPPAGIAYAGLILGGIRAWPAILLGLLFSELITPREPIFLLFSIIANIVGPVSGVYLIRHHWSHNPSSLRFRSTLSLYMGGVLLAVVSAALGTAGYLISGQTLELGTAPLTMGWFDFFFVWAQGDLFGVVVFTPAVISIYLSLRHPAQGAERYFRLREKLAWVFVTSLAVVFWPQMVDQMPNYQVSLIFLPAMLLGWAALRFDHRFTTVCVMMVLIGLTVYVGYLSHGLPPAENAFERGMLMFIFLLIGVIPVLTSAAVRENRFLSSQLVYRANHDSLTGLPNRVAFEEQTSALINQMKIHQGKSTVCYVDLDNFKVVNDTSGHFAGDEQLKQIAYLIRNNITEADVLARLGGDEFGLLLVDCDGITAKARIDSLLSIIQDYRFIWQNNIFNITASVGMVEVGLEHQSYSQVMRLADVACFEAKDKGGNCSVLYGQTDHMESSPTMMHWAAQINAALERNQMMLYVQQIWPVAVTADDGVHFEILLRMPDENGEVLEAKEFIMAAERFRFMPRIDQWVIENTARFFDQNRIDFNKTKLISVNLSGQSLSQPSFLSQVQKILASYPDIAARLCFEITETTAIGDLQHAKDFIESVQKFGCKFALDDFGSGLSSFQYLKFLPVDFVKIDGIFVRDIHENAEDRTMVTAINNVAHVLGKKTVAEYVDSEAVTHILKEIGIDYAQGFTFSRPLPITDFFKSLS